MSRALKALLSPEDDAAKLRAKMSAVVLGQREHSLLEITRALLTENAKGVHAKYDALVDYGLDDFYWRGVASIYGYESASPSIDDLVLWIFRRAIEGFRSDRPGGLQNIQLDFASLRNDRRTQAAMAALAKRAAAIWTTPRASRTRASATWWRSTCSRRPTRRSSAIWRVRWLSRRSPPREVAEVVRARQSSVWIDGYRQLYTAIASASELLGELASLDLGMQSFDDGLERYRREWFRIDQLYRQFIARHANSRVPQTPGGPARPGREALHEQVRLRAGQRLAAAGRPGRRVALDHAALADRLLRRLRRAAGA